MNWFRRHQIVWSPLAVVWNVLLLYVAYSVTRLAFYLENKPVYEHLSGFGDVWSIVCGGLYFDTSAICYTNALYLLLVFFPCHLKENRTYQHFCK